MKYKTQIPKLHRKRELIDELSDALETLKAEVESLEAEIKADLIAPKSKERDYEVLKSTKLNMICLAGQVVFSMNTGYALERKNGKRLDDQAWLKTLQADADKSKYVRSRLSFNKNSVRATPDNEALVKSLGLRLAPTISIQTRRVRSEAEINQLLAEAEAETPASEE